MRLAALPVLALLAACSAEKAPEPTPTLAATVEAPRTLVAADFDPATLGAGVAGMEVTDAGVGDGLARVTAFVACPKEMTACDPTTVPAGTVYTYVVTITPQAIAEPIASPAAGETPVAPAELVRMTRATSGFNGAVGYATAEAAAALGEEDALTVTLDQNQLIWRVTGGSGWKAGKPISLWWQSTFAPAKPSPAYRLEYGGKRADITAPFPAADKPVEREAGR